MQMMSTNVQPLTKVLVCCALILSLIVGSLSPTVADTAGQTSTRNIALGALAVAVGIVLNNNYQHKVVAANSVVGYTRDGGVVYGDGRIVYPNNITTYASSDGSRACTFDRAGVPCRPTHVFGYFQRGYKPPCWPPGHCKDYWKKHQHDHDNGNGNGNGNHG